VGEMIAIYLQCAAICFASLSATLWFWSSRIGPKSVETPPDGPGDGDLLFKTGDSEYLYWGIWKQGRVNAAAAICTGVATLMGAVALLLGNSNYPPLAASRSIPISASSPELCPTPSRARRAAIAVHTPP
jgi:hypothetical protein